MSSSSVPVTLGSESAGVVELEGLRINNLHFPPGAVLDLHAHERATFATMLDGSFDLVLPGRRLECPPATVLTEPPGERHGNEIGTGGAWVLVLQPELEDNPLIEPCSRMLEDLNHFVSARIRQLARRLAAEFRIVDPVSPLSMEGLALEMLALAARLDEAERKAGQPPAWLSRVREMIHDRFLDDLRVRDLASEAGVHPSYLSSRFKEHYGETLGGYVRSLRLEWAAERLTSSDDPIGRIALQAGFADQSHFGRRFKRRTGMTPGAYRRARAGSHFRLASRIRATSDASSSDGPG